MKTQHGTLTKKSGKWMGHYSRWVINSTTGDKTRQQRAFVIGRLRDHTKTEAKRILQTRIEEELYLKDSRITVRAFIERHWQPMREGTWKSSTRETNLGLLSHIIKRFGTVPLEDMTTVEIQVWLNGVAKKRSGSLVKHLHLFLRSIFLEAVDADFLRKSPARLLRLPLLKPVNKPFLSLEEIRLLLDAADGMHKLLLRVELCTGLRPGELFALRWSAFDPVHSLLHVTDSIYKGEHRAHTKTTNQDSQKELQRVYLPESLARELSEYRRVCRWHADSDYIFAAANGGPRWKEHYNARILRPLAKKAGIAKLNFQIIRRTVATHAQNLGSAKDIASLLRHTKPDTAALHYTQTQDESVRRTVERLAQAFDKETTKTVQ
jgi:integrase